MDEKDTREDTEKVLKLVDDTTPMLGWCNIQEEPELHSWHQEPCFVDTKQNEERNRDMHVLLSACECQCECHAGIAWVLVRVTAGCWGINRAADCRGLHGDALCHRFAGGLPEAAGDLMDAHKNARHPPLAAAIRRFAYFEPDIIRADSRIHV